VSGACGVHVRPVAEEELPMVAAVVAEEQADPERHIGYVATDAGAIATDLRDLEPAGLAGVLVAVDGDQLVGVLGAEWDTDPPRVWWHGPFVADVADRTGVAEALLAAGQALLPESVVQEEMAPDDRNSFVADVARRRGLAPDEASAVLHRSTAPPGDPVQPPAGVAIGPLEEQDRAAVAGLHDVAFPVAHTPGDRIDEGTDRLVLVARREAPDDRAEVLGFAAVERQADGSGYLDLLAVAPDARGTGLGAALVEAACSALHTQLGCEVVNLTVRETNPARRLYQRLGFTEERVLRPYRRGFGISGFGTTGG
jgi:ribosomal protein S18 acetylase RimI-like enzyme